MLVYHTTLVSVVICCQDILVIERKPTRSVGALVLMRCCDEAFPGTLPVLFCQRKTLYGNTALLVISHVHHMDNWTTVTCMKRTK